MNMHARQVDSNVHAETHSDNSKRTNVEPGRDSLSRSERDGHATTSNSIPSRHDQGSHTAQSNATTEQTSGNIPEDVLQPIDRIETVKKDRSDSDDQTLHDAGNAHNAVKSAKKQIYLHHRNKKDLGKQFTAGSAHQHLGLTDSGTYDEEKAESADQPASTVLQNFWIMLTTFPYWNMAFWSGWCYSIGSALFIIDGCWSWTPLQWPESEFEGESKYGVPLLFFFGACLYQVGGVMAYLEAVNDGSFAGAAMKKLLKGNTDIERELLDAKLHTFFGHLVPHHHHDDDNHDHNEIEKWESVHKKESPESVYDEAKERVERRRGGIDHGPTEKGEVSEYLVWRWWPTWHALRTYHIFELGYIACTIQLFGVTLYGVTSVVILPGIFDSLEWWQEIAAYWVPQVVASCCFLIASIMFTIMAQDRWYKPKVGAVSWWIGIHAQIGSVGFLLCAIFGFYSNDHTWGEYQSSLSSLWGSFFYMLSGLFQWYEAINTNVGPVLAFPNNRTPVLLRKRQASSP